MSFQSAIPWQVALRQSLPPLHRLETILNNPRCRTMIFQQTATAPLTSCLSPRVHSTAPFPGPHPQKQNPVVYTNDLTHLSRVEITRFPLPFWSACCIR